MMTNHYRNNRSKREKFIQEHLGGDGKMVDGFIVDKGHSNGLEVHSVTEHGIILIHNLKSGKLITKLLARENRTITWLADEMTKISNKKYTLKSISDKLARKTLQYEEFILILKILNYEIKFEKIKEM